MFRQQPLQRGTRDPPECSPRPLDVDVSGCHELRLVVGDAGDGNWHDHADWAAARLVPARAGALAAGASR